MMTDDPKADRARLYEEALQLQGELHGAETRVLSAARDPNISDDDFLAFSDAAIAVRYRLRESWQRLRDFINDESFGGSDDD